MGYVGKVTTGDSTHLVGSTLYGTCDTAAGTAAKVVTCGDFDALITGVTIHVKFTYANSVASPTLNVNGTGAKNIYRYGTTAPSTSAASSWNAGAVVTFTYDGSYWIMNDWINNNDNTYAYYTSNYYGAGYKAKTVTYRYQILLTCPDSKLLPINTVSNSTATTKTLTTIAFDPFAPIHYYSSTSTVNADAAFANSVVFNQHHSIDLRYSFNTGTTLTIGLPIYIVAEPQTDGTAVLASSPISQTLPDAENGLIYIYLGRAYTTSAIVLEDQHPIYYYKDDAIREWTNMSIADMEESVNELSNSLAGFQETVANTYLTESTFNNAFSVSSEATLNTDVQTYIANIAQDVIDNSSFEQTITNNVLEAVDDDIGARLDNLETQVGNVTSSLKHGYVSDGTNTSYGVVVSNKNVFGSGSAISNPTDASDPNDYYPISTTDQFQMVTATGMEGWSGTNKTVIMNASSGDISANTATMSQSVRIGDYMFLISGDDFGLKYVG